MARWMDQDDMEWEQAVADYAPLEDWARGRKPRSKSDKKAQRVANRVRKEWTSKADTRFEHLLTNH